MQASFQMLALQAAVEGGLKPHRPVRGLIVSVLEYKKPYAPKRKCKGCKETYEYSSYRFVADEGKYRCPMCDTVQELTPLKTDQLVVQQPTLYRVVTERTDWQLTQARAEIQQVADVMETMRKYGRGFVPPNRERCVDTRFGQCPYYGPDNLGGEVVEGQGFVKVQSLQYLERSEV